jgi:hypothetical protein
MVLPRPPISSFTEWDDELDAAGVDWIATQDAVILGRRSYDEWVGFWQGSEIEPFATFINTVPKYVATSTPLDPEWANVSAIDGGLVDFVRDLKNQPGGDIGVHASISAAQTSASRACRSHACSWSRFGCRKSTPSSGLFILCSGSATDRSDAQAGATEQLGPYTSGRIVNGTFTQEGS